MIGFGGKLLNDAKRPEGVSARQLVVIDSEPSCLIPSSLDTS